MLDTARLSDVIKQQGLTVSTLADNIGIDRSTFYRKLKSGGGTFLLWEIDSIVKYLGLTGHDALDIFLS